MSIAGVVNILRRTSTFGALGPDRLNVLAFSGERIRFEPGDILVKADQVPARCLVIVEGAVEVSTDSGHGERILGVAITIGETALITNQPGGLRVAGHVAGEVLVITRPLFERVVEEFPDIAIHLRDQMRGRLGETLRQLSALERRLRYQGGEEDRNGPEPGRGPTVSPSLAPRRSR